MNGRQFHSGGARRLWNAVATTVALGTATLVLSRGPATCRAGDCPEGSVLAGKGPPDGDAQWCEKDHVKHGPYHAWTVTGVKTEEGWYEHGQREGRWTSFWDRASASVPPSVGRRTV